MGTSSSRTSNSSGNSRFTTRNNSKTAFDPTSPPASSGSGTNTQLQKSLNRRRSAKNSLESPNSSDVSNHKDIRMLPSPQEGDEEEFRWIDGRRYHNTTSLYMLPNDPQEVDRLHVQHYILKVALEGNIHVPLPAENGRVIDFGCGPATWCMDMATDHQSVNFVGVDISAIFPTAIFPRNCNFYHENFLDGVSQPDGTFDVVFQRNVSCGLTFELWQKAMAEAFRVLKPGGYYECVEAEYQLHNCGPFTFEYFEHLLMIMAYGSVDPLLVRSLDRLMVAAGFRDVKVKEYMVPIGQWGGKIGVMWQQNVLTGMGAVKSQLSKTAGMTEQQVADASVKLEKELSEGRTHSIVHVVVGRKPE